MKQIQCPNVSDLLQYYVCKGHLKYNNSSARKSPNSCTGKTFSRNRKAKKKMYERE